jgi:hypothetical protein
VTLRGCYGRLQRTVDLTRASAEALTKAHKGALSLLAFARFWQVPISCTHSVLVKRNPFTLSVKLGRRPADVRLRLARLSKPERCWKLGNACAVVRAGLRRAGGIAKKK